MADRFMAEAKALDILRSLTSSTYAPRSIEIKSKPFTELKFAFLWAVSLGVIEGTRTSLQGTKDGVFMTSNLNDDQKAFLYTIAIAETDNLEVVENEDTVVSIAEEYANTGAYRLRELLLDAPGDELWNLVSFIRSEASK